MSNITFRAQLLGGVTDFCTDCDLAIATPQVLVDLIVRLARYQEEGLKLAPQVYLTDNIDFIVNMLPDGEKIVLGTISANGSGLEEVLKISAPLATGEWRIYANQMGPHIEFGVFRGSTNPISVEVDDIVLSGQTGATVVKAHHVVNECVQIRSSRGHNHHIFFSDRKEESPPPLNYVDDLLLRVVSQVKEAERDAVRGLVTKTIVSALLKSHGCILAVTNMKGAPRALSKDGVILKEPIDFPLMIRQLNKARQSKADFQFIERRSQLVEGMIMSDGITLFDEYGRLLGYRCFVPLLRNRAEINSVVGGARTRAFEALKKHIGRGLSAAFMQSQDGWTNFEGKDHG